MVSKEQEKHLENVTQFLSKVKSTILVEELNSFGIKGIRLWEEYITQPYSGFKLNCDFFHKDDYILNRSSNIYEHDVVKNTENLFSILSGYNASLVSYELSTKSSIILDLNENLEKRFFDLLLSKELKALLDYRNLHNELTKQTPTNKRLKV